MSSKLDSDMLASVNAANMAWQNFNAAIAAYQAHVTRGLWAEAEKERERAIAALETHLDQIAAAHKRLEHERGGKG